LLVESVLLAAIAGVLGVVVARAGVEGFTAIAPRTLTEFHGGPIRLDARVLVVSGMLVSLTALLFGTGPALVASRLRGRLTGSERSSTGGRGVQRVRAGLAVTELALAMTLLVTAGLLVRSLSGMLSREPGYDAERLLVLDLWLPPARYPDLATQRAFQDQLLERLRALPGADQVTLAEQVPPVAGFQVGPALQAEGEAALAEQPLMLPNIRVDTSYFTTLGIPIVEGRAFGGRDVVGGTPSAIIDRDLARALWPGQSALGRRFRTSETSTEWLTVVGVAADVELLGVADLRADECRAGACDYEVYRALDQGGRTGQHGIAIRTAGDPRVLASPVRQAVRDLDDAIPLPTPQTGNDRIRRTLADQRFVLRVMAVFTVIAVLLAAIGVYGVLAYGVARRTREIGVRIALGADGRAVLHGVLGRTTTIVVYGLTLGLAGALAAGRIVRSLLVDISPAEPIALGAAAVALAIVALLAALGPAVRAMRISALDALRVE
jgi:predicted permease